MNVNIIDIGIILILIASAIAGWKRGVIKEGVSFVGIVLVFVIAYAFKENLGNVLCKYLPFFDFGGNLKGIVSLNILFYQVLAFFIIYSVLFGIYQLILKISGLLQKIVNFTIILALPSKLGGALISVIKSYIVIFAVLLVLLVPFKNAEIIAGSAFIEKIVNNTPILSSYTKDITNTISDTYSLVDDLTNEKLTVNEANIELIDAMLKYDVVSKKTVEQLVVLDKLKTVKGLDKILEKY